MNQTKKDQKLLVNFINIIIKISHYYKNFIKTKSNLISIKKNLTKKHIN